MQYMNQYASTIPSKLNADKNQQIKFYFKATDEFFARYISTC